MSESINPSPCTQAEHEAALKAGLLFATPGTNAQDVAIHKFAETIRGGQPAPPSIVAVVLSEIDRAMLKFPTWPTDPLHALAVLGEEFGELNKAMLQLTYEPHKTSASEVRSEAIQTAAMAVRLAMSLDRYRYTRSEQHEQGGTDQ